MSTSSKGRRKQPESKSYHISFRARTSELDIQRWIERRVERGDKREAIAMAIRLHIAYEALNGEEADPSGLQAILGANQGGQGPPLASSELQAALLAVAPQFAKLIAQEVAKLVPNIGGAADVEDDPVARRQSEIMSAGLAHNLIDFGDDDDDD